jgi:putative DNA primase/helicase
MSDQNQITDAPEDDGDGDNIKLLPTWRQALAELEQAGIHAGQVIGKRWLEERSRQEDAERAAKAARRVWAKCSPDGDCDYLRKKGVSAHGVRFSPQGAMVMPVLDTAGNIHGLQVIRSSAKAVAGAPAKQFWPSGIAVKGHFYQIGSPAPGGILLLAEGYATAATLYEATGLPVAVAFSANNLAPVAVALDRRYKMARILVCADDDAAQKCRHEDCRKPVWLPDGPTCPHCGRPHEAGNAGISSASAAALAVGCAWVAPEFADAAARRDAWMLRGKKLSDYNDLQAAEGAHVVRTQIETRILALGWRQRDAARGAQPQGGGDSDELHPIESIDELLERFSLVYGQGGTVFDAQEHILVAVSDMRDACLTRQLHRAWAEHPDRRIVRQEQVGFDPACTDASITCNLWAGWPTKPKQGRCENLIDLLRYMCAGDKEPEKLFDWVLRWLAYPIQRPGAKMRTTLVLHGPQGTGKNMFFEAIMAIYGRYGRVIDQAAIEDKFNDWASRKLFLIADEVLARSELYHIKNKLKAFVTGDWIRINPKNMAAYDERNHVNMVFLSNEAMPVVLEEDDRRHAVIWTPEKLSPEFYAAVLDELRNGGVAALHHYLLHVDLGDMHEGSMPPMTDAKKELIGLSLDSPSKFCIALETGDVEGFPPTNSGRALSPCLSTDLYELYTTWCRSVGLKALNQPRFANALMRKHGAVTERKRYSIAATFTTKGPAAITYLRGGPELPPGEQEADWLGDRIEAFRTALKDYRGRMPV